MSDDLTPLIVQTSEVTLLRGALEETRAELAEARAEIARLRADAEQMIHPTEREVAEARALLARLVEVNPGSMFHRVATINAKKWLEAQR